jgi:hypothetical protein
LFFLALTFSVTHQFHFHRQQLAKEFVRRDLKWQNNLAHTKKLQETVSDRIYFGVVVQFPKLRHNPTIPTNRQ